MFRDQKKHFNNIKGKTKCAKNFVGEPKKQKWQNELLSLHNLWGSKFGIWIGLNLPILSSFREE